IGYRHAGNGRVGEIVLDLEDRHRPVADGLHADDGELAQDQPPVSVAVVQLIVSVRSEAAAAVPADGPGRRGDHGGDRRLVRVYRVRQMLPGAIKIGQVNGHVLSPFSPQRREEREEELVAERICDELIAVPSSSLRLRGGSSESRLLALAFPVLAKLWLLT